MLVYPRHSTPGYLNSSKRPFPYCSKALNFKVQNLSYKKEFYLQEKRIENHNIFISKASFAIALVLKQRFFVTQKWPKSFRRPLCRPVIPSIFVSVSHVNSINYVLSTYTYLYNHSLSRKFVRIAYLSG